MLSCLRQRTCGGNDPDREARARLFSSRRRRRRSAISRRVGCCGGDGSRFQCFGSSECFCWRASVNFWMCLSTSSSLFRHGCLSCCGKFPASGRHPPLLSNFFFFSNPPPVSSVSLFDNSTHFAKMKRLAGNYRVLEVFPTLQPKEEKVCNSLFLLPFSFRISQLTETVVFDCWVVGNWTSLRSPVTAISSSMKIYFSCVSKSSSCCT